MAVHVLDAMAREGFEELIALHDRASGLRAFLAIHDSSDGPAFGGIRRFAYRSEKNALMDCLRLSKAMSLKCALAGLRGGGGKLVLIDRDDLDIDAAYRHLGTRIERLRGRFYAGPDVGTGWNELARVAETTRYVTPPGHDGPGELAEATAAGVFAGMAAALRHLDGDEDWPRRVVVVQGLGSVGIRVARRLCSLGVRVLASEIDPARGARARDELGLGLIEPGTEAEHPCDVYCPCAMGGILHDLTIQRLSARVVCGAANNLLARSHHADRLHARGILYMPDFVVNAGAVILGAERHLNGRATPPGEVEKRIGRLSALVLGRSSAIRSPYSVAVREAEERRAAAGRPSASPYGGPEDEAGIEADSVGTTGEA